MYNVQLIHSFHCFEFIELTLNNVKMDQRKVRHTPFHKLNATFTELIMAFSPPKCHI